MPPKFDPNQEYVGKAGAVEKLPLGELVGRAVCVSM